MALELRELLWTLRSSVAAVELRLELLRRTWPRSPPEWLEEEEVRDLLRPYLESSQLPLLLQLLHSAPRAWCNATRTRTRTLLALVEPCDVHLLRVRLDVIFGLSPEMCAGRCHMRLRLAKAGSWMESSSFFLAVPPFPSRPAGCFLDNEFQFSIPVSSGDSVLSLFGPGATGLEVQLVDEDRSPLLQGELSPAEFLAHMELGPGEAAASCIKLEPAESFQCTGLKSCSVAGLMAGPQLQLVLRCSQMAAPLDALPYWAEPRLATPWQPLPKVTMEESGATDLAPQTETVTMEESGATDLAPQTETVTMEESGATDLAPQTETVTVEEASRATDLAPQTETVELHLPVDGLKLQAPLDIEVVTASKATDLAHLEPLAPLDIEVVTASKATDLAHLEPLEPWLQAASPRALLSRVVETAQLAVDMVAGLGQPVSTVPADVAPSAGKDVSKVAAKDSKDDLDTTVSSLDLPADSKAQGPLEGPGPFSARRVQRCPAAEDEPEPAAEEFLDAEPMGGAAAAPHPKSTGAAALPKHDMPLFTPGTGAGVPPPKSLEPESVPTTPVQAWQLGGRGPLQPDLVREPMAMAIGTTSAISANLPRDLSPAVAAEPKMEVAMTAVQTAGPTCPEIQSPELEELPMVSFRRQRATSPMSPASPVWEVENETTLMSRLDRWGATRSPPRWPQKPRWAGTWTLSPSVPSPPQRAGFSGLGSTRSTMTPRQRLEDLAADAGPKAPPSPRLASPRGSLASPARWSERLDVNTKRLAKILRSCAMDESSDSS